MPQRGGSKRTAARQTQLGQRKKRQTRGPSGIPAPSDEQQATEVHDGAARPGDAPEASSRSTTAVAQRPSHSRAGESRSRVYLYIGSEVRRIAGVSAAAFAILIVLAIFLR